MITPPATEFLLLAATLLDAIDPSGSVLDTTLLQLQALFGPMLMSALQLIDRREVVHVSLPDGRSVFQVTSSTGNPYTLYLDVPERPKPVQADSIKVPLAPIEDPPNSPSLQSSHPPSELADYDRHIETIDEKLDSRMDEMMRRKRLLREARAMERMYCPCAGFAYNSLSGDRNVLCKHLLAVIIAHKLNKEVKTSVRLQGVVDLLGLNRVSEEEAGVNVEGGAAGFHENLAGAWV